MVPWQSRAVTAAVDGGFRASNGNAKIDIRILRRPRAIISRNRNQGDLPATGR
jgi:hypothetical protein